MKKHIQIKLSYDVWKPHTMKTLIMGVYSRKYGNYSITRIENFPSLVIEWWLHNIGYHVTKPFVSVPKLKRINERCKHVDLMVEGGW